MIIPLNKSIRHSIYKKTEMIFRDKPRHNKLYKLLEAEIERDFEFVPTDMSYFGMCRVLILILRDLYPGEIISTHNLHKYLPDFAAKAPAHVHDIRSYVCGSFWFSRDTEGRKKRHAILLQLIEETKP